MTIKIALAVILTAVRPRYLMRLPDQPVCRELVGRNGGKKEGRLKRTRT